MIQADLLENKWRRLNTAAPTIDLTKEDPIVVSSCRPLPSMDIFHKHSVTIIDISDDDEMSSTPIPIMLANNRKENQMSTIETMDSDSDLNGDLSLGRLVGHPRKLSVIDISDIESYPSVTSSSAPNILMPQQKRQKLSESTYSAASTMENSYRSDDDVIVSARSDSSNIPVTDVSSPRAANTLAMTSTISPVQLPTAISNTCNSPSFVESFHLLFPLSEIKLPIHEAGRPKGDSRCIHCRGASHYDLLSKQCPRNPRNIKGKDICIHCNCRGHKSLLHKNLELNHECLVYHFFNLICSGYLEELDQLVIECKHYRFPQLQKQLMNKINILAMIRWQVLTWKEIKTEEFSRLWGKYVAILTDDSDNHHLIAQAKCKVTDFSRKMFQQFYLEIVRNER